MKIPFCFFLSFFIFSVLGASAQRVSPETFMVEQNDAYKWYGSTICGERGLLLSKTKVQPSGKNLDKTYTFYDTSFNKIKTRMVKIPKKYEVTYTDYGEDYILKAHFGRNFKYFLELVDLNKQEVYTLQLKKRGKPLETLMYHNGLAILVTQGAYWSRKIEIITVDVKGGGSEDRQMVEFPGVKTMWSQVKASNIIKNSNEQFVLVEFGTEDFCELLKFDEMGRMKKYRIPIKKGMLLLNLRAVKHEDEYVVYGSYIDRIGGGVDGIYVVRLTEDGYKDHKLYTFFDFEGLVDKLGAYERKKISNKMKDVKKGEHLHANFEDEFNVNQLVPTDDGYFLVFETAYDSLRANRNHGYLYNYFQVLKINDELEIDWIEHIPSKQLCWSYELVKNIKPKAEGIQMSYPRNNKWVIGEINGLGEYSDIYVSDTLYSGFINTENKPIRYDYRDHWYGDVYLFRGSVKVKDKRRETDVRYFHKYHIPTQVD